MGRAVLDLRKTSKHSRECLPVGTIRVRQSKKSSGRGRFRVRMIKVRNSGPKGRRWIDYARWWWEKNKATVPAGMDVIHLDGDALNDAPENLSLGTSADRAYLWHERDPEGSRRNYEKCRAATIAMNIERGRISRATRFYPDKWYAVDHDAKLIDHIPHRRRWQVFAEAPPNPLRSLAWALGWPELTSVQALALDLLSRSQGMSAGELLPAIAERRRFLGYALARWHARLGSLYAEITKLKARNLVYGHGRRPRRYRANAVAIETRGPVSSLWPVKGRDADVLLANGYGRRWEAELEGVTASSHEWERENRSAIGENSRRLCRRRCSGSRLSSLDSRLFPTETVMDGVKPYIPADTPKREASP